MQSTSDVVKEVTNLAIDPVVTVEIIVDDAMKNRLRAQQEAQKEIA